MNPRTDITGRRFGKLTVIRFQYGKGGWLCKCDCGKERWFNAYELTAGNNSSCGCLSAIKIARVRHGLRLLPEYKIWVAMIKRCENPKNKDYKYYGGRGIKVCARWRNSFEAFLEDVGRRPDGCWIDRKDTNGNYEPGNVQWKTPTQQQRNKRSNHLYPFGELMLTIKEIHEKWEGFKVGFYTFKSRMAKKWGVERSITQPVRGS